MTDSRPEDRPAADASDPAERPESAAGPAPEPTPAPEPAAQPAAAQPAPEPTDPRPRPAYGEYAPEGWTWTPPQKADAASAASASGFGGSVPPVSSVSADALVDAEVPTRLPGVPHNLGARPGGQGGAPASPGTTASTSAPITPARPAPGQHAPGQHAPAQQPHANQPAPAHAPLPQQPPQPGLAKPRTADRVITVLLLVVGAFGALNIAFELYRFPLSQRTMAELLGVSDYAAPGWLGPVGIVCAIAVLALYAVSLILSVRRLRANKLTFFVPLIAGVAAFLLVMVVTLAAMAGSPELMNALQDPDALSKMMDSLRTTPSK
ncbi:DUF6264 family protein [Leucobacter sp. HNU]|uniref:DUF6264 family protein n=1 Tax=Leucobacter sp. HNU TaxID=3236805 RepID=UPI003A808340